MWHTLPKEIAGCDDMSFVETAVTAAEGASIRARVTNVLPLAGLGLALIANAIWIGFLGYCVLKLV